MSNKKVKQDIDNLSLGIISGITSGIIILSGTKFQEVLSTHGYKTLGDIIFVGIITIPFIYFVRHYLKNK